MILNTFISPSRLYTLAKLFHLTPKDYQCARILDLNLTPNSPTVLLASQFKTVQVVGFTHSIEHKKALKEAIGRFNLNNIELIENDFLSLNAALGQFDYIICQALYAYVSKVAQDHIMALCTECLAPNGVISISYDTLPGWNIRRSIQEMMRYHVADIAFDEKIVTARALLHFLLEGIGSDTTPYARFLKEEIQLISNYTESEFYQIYLSESHSALYFYEFIEKAADHQLAYLSDSYLPLMFPGNLKEKIKTQLAPITDVIQLGQYLDFLRNQTHRNTLLCHATQSVNRNLNLEVLMQGYIAYAGLYNQTIYNASLGAGKIIEFEVGGLVPLKISLTLPLAKIAMKILYEQAGKPLSYASWIKKTMQTSKASEQDVKSLFHNELNLGHLLLTGLIQVYPDKDVYPVSSTNKLSTLPLIQWMAQISPYVPNVLSESYKLTPIERLLLQCLQGSHSTPQLLIKCEALLQEKVGAQEIVLKDEAGRPLTDKKLVLKHIKRVSKAALEALTKRGYLV